MTAFVPTVTTAPADGGWTGAVGHRKETVVSGDLTDFTEFVQSSLPGLLRYGHALTGNPHDAADLVQSVLEKIGSRWTSVQRKTGDPLAYVRRSMANAHISRWRRLRRESLVAEIPEPVSVSAPDPFEHEPLWQALRELPPRQRAVIVLRYYEGLSESEIASSLGVSQGTVKSQASKALGSLRGKLRHNGGSESCEGLDGSGGSEGREVV